MAGGFMKFLVMNKFAVLGEWVGSNMWFSVTINHLQVYCMGKTDKSADVLCSPNDIWSGRNYKI